MSDFLKLVFAKVKNSGFLHVYSANMIILLSAFLSQLVVAQVLDKEQLADIRLLQVYFGVFSVICIFGVNYFILKRITESSSVLVRQYILSTALFVSCVISVLSLIVVNITNVLYGITSSNTANDFVFLQSLHTVFLTLATISFSYFQSQRRFSLISKINIKSKLIGVVLTISLTFLFGVNGFFIALTAGSFITCFYYFIEYRTANVNIITPRKPKVLQCLNFGWLVFLANITGVTILQSIDVFFIDKIVGSGTELGLYAFATIFITALMQLTVSIQSIAAPALSKVSANRSVFFKTLLKWQSILLVSSICLAIISLVVVPLFASFVFADKYVGFEEYYYWLVARYVVFNIFSLFGLGFVMLGLTKINLAINCIIIPVMFFVCELMIKRYGVLGGPISQLIIYCCLLVSYLIAFVYLFSNQKIVTNKGGIHTND